MPGNTNQPDPKLPHNVPQPTSGTAGEFTQVFASGAVPPPTPAEKDQVPLPSGDDEFAKMFLSPAKPMDSSVKPVQRTADNEATLIFEAMPSVTATPRTPPVTPSLPVERNQTAMVTPSAPRAFDFPSSEFTQIFSPIAPPVAPPPEVKAAAKPPTQSSGEFTQFFSAISARENGSAPAPPRAIPQVLGSTPAAPDKRDVSTKPVGDFDRMFPQSPSGSAGPSFKGFEQPPSAANTPAAANSQAQVAGAFTQVFQQQPASPEPFRSLAPTPAASSAGGDSFTQVFQQIAPPQARGDAASMPQMPVQPTSLVVPTPVTGGSAQAWPAFGPPPQPSGTFTDVFAAQPSSSGTAWPGGPPAAAPAAQSGGFTEVFRSTPTATSSQPGAWPFPDLAKSSALGGSSLQWPGQPQSPASQAAPLVSGGGDFTALMQSLTPSAQGPASASPQNDAFFAASPGIGSVHQESEFTRVQRASSRREAGSADSVVPAAGAAVGPGLAMAPPKDKGAEKEAPAKKSKTLVILLVAMNVLLLLVLIVIGLLVLRRK